MKVEKIVPIALEFAVILLASWVSTYGFQFVKGVAPDEISNLRNVVYLMAVILSFSAMHRHNRLFAFMFSLTLSTLFLLFTAYGIAWDLPLTTFFLATMLGVLSVILIPEARGMEFSVFLIILVLPLLLAESRILGWMAPQEMEVFFRQTYPTFLVVVGGCLYLRYATGMKLMGKELLLKGADPQELLTMRWWSSFFAITAIACAMGVNSIVAEFVTTVVNQLSYRPTDSFIFLLILAGVVGAAILISIYAISHKLATR
jgi:hypothetical protein